MKSTLMPIFLQKHLFALGLLIPRFLCMFEILLQSLFLWQSTPSLNLFTLLFTSNLSFFVPFYSCKFSKPPCIELARWIDTVSVIDIDNLLFFFL